MFQILCSQMFVSGKKLCIKKVNSIDTSSRSSSPDQKQTADIFKLNFDCFQENFDHLSLLQLAVLSLTCKFMNQTVGEFYKHNFRARVRGESENIYSYDHSVMINCFIPYVQSILIEGNDLHIFRMKKFTSLKEIEFDKCKLNCTECLSGILRNVECLKFLDGFDGDAYELFLRHCDKLKRLYVMDSELKGKNSDVYFGTSNDWLAKPYSSLEHFEFISRRKIDQVIEFLKQNTKIHNFSTTIEFLIANMDAILVSKLKLNILAILYAYTNVAEEKFNQLMAQLALLHQREIFKQLNLYFYVTPIQYTIYPPNVMSLVKTLHIVNGMQNFTLSPLVNLERLYLSGTFQINDLDVALKTATKLNYIYFHDEKIDNILPFIKNSPTLSKIQINLLQNGIHFNDANNVLNLSALNDERQKLHKATKITIFAHEQIYLETKKQVKQTNFDFVEIKRTESYDGVHDFTVL